ncbi:phosphoribosylformylglycinamidine synthase subunit PurQ [Nitrospira sp. M1]
MNVGIITFPGSNCDRDCQHVVRNVLGYQAHLIWHRETSLSNVDVVILPGGFSYGDYLRTGAIARFSPIMESIQQFAEKGGIVLGICNGFQILLEAGLLPGAMLKNQHLSFICQDVCIKVENAETTFTNEYTADQVLTIPIAHAEGNYYADPMTLSALQEHAQIVFRYCDTRGNVTAEANPNGSLENIAGIRNKAGNVLGMMPHPERCAESVFGMTDGVGLFTSLRHALNQMVA